jgi:hypothetical protein
MALGHVSASPVDAPTAEPVHGKGRSEMVENLVSIIMRASPMDPCGWAAWSSSVHRAGPGRDRTRKQETCRYVSQGGGAAGMGRIGGSRR